MIKYCQSYFECYFDCWNNFYNMNLIRDKWLILWCKIDVWFWHLDFLFIGLLSAFFYWPLYCCCQVNSGIGTVESMLWFVPSAQQELNPSGSDIYSQWGSVLFVMIVHINVERETIFITMLLLVTMKLRWFHIINFLFYLIIYLMYFVIFECWI